MQPRSNRPLSFLEGVRAVVVSIDDPGRQKIGQARQGLHNIVARCREYPLLRDLVGNGGGGQFAFRKT